MVHSAPGTLQNGHGPRKTDDEDGVVVRLSPGVHQCVDHTCHRLSRLPKEPTAETGPIAAVIQERPTTRRLLVPPLQCPLLNGKLLARPLGPTTPFELEKLPDSSLLGQASGLSKGRRPGTRPVDHELNTSSLCSLGHAHSVRISSRHGLFQDDVRTDRCCGLRHIGMLRVLRTANNDVRLLFRQQLSPVVIDIGNTDDLLSPA